MARYNRLNDYLVIDGVRLDDCLIDVQIQPSIGTVENTAGSDEAVSRFETVRDYSLSLSIVYEIDKEAVLLPLISPGRHHVIYGIRGNLKGAPKHQQEFIITEAGVSGEVGGARRYFAVSAAGAAPPVDDMYQNAVF